MDAYCEYDGLQQVTEWKRGNLSPSSGPPFTGVTSQKQGENFTYDQTGNWLGDVSDTPTFTQSRTHNVKNQISTITGPSGVVQPAYDTAGNMTLAPSPAAWATGYAYKWDAWNRLVEIKRSDTHAVVGSYAYDALTRRTRKTVGGVTRDIYYDRQWRSLEEREAGSVKAQHTWSPLDRWTLIRRKRSVSGTLDETLFCLRDYLDPVALANTSGAVVERYSYDAFGTALIMDAAFAVRSSSAYDWDFLYHGEFRDKESELYNYGYRYLDTQLGRWLSRDPLQNEGEANLYRMLGNDLPNWFDLVGRQKVAPQKAPSGKMQVIVKSVDPKKDDCRFAYVSWSFKLSQPAPCDGYIVQKVKSFDTERPCGAARPAKPPVQEFWEAFPVSKNSITTIIEEKTGSRSDQSYRPTPWDTCGDYESEGIVTFVCNDITGDLGTVFFNEANPGGWVSVSPGGESNGWGPGHDGWPGNRKSGPLPSTQNKPKWWDDSLNQVIPGRRLHNVNWSCCNSGRNFTDHKYEPL